MTTGSTQLKPAVVARVKSNEVLETLPHTSANSPIGFLNEMVEENPQKTMIIMAQ